MAQSKISVLKESKDQTILIFNYAMNPDDPIFSHQLDAVVGLAAKFKKVIVITQKEKASSLPNNVQVINLNWNIGRNISNSTHFLLVLCQVIVEHKPDLVFSHMTEKLSLLAAPLLRIIGIPHFLWYAHSSKSFSLRITSLMVKAIFTSTAGSCAIKASRVRILGQAIDVSKFQGSVPQISDPKNYVHVGRLDRSKNIELLIQQVLINRSGNTLSLIGAPSGTEAAIYWRKIKSKYANFLSTQELVANGPIPRPELPALLGRFDVFIHAFNGSLDKSILEATACGLPVVTTNTEYVSIFGSWSEKFDSSNLGAELSAFLNKPLGTREIELKRRATLVKDNHSFNSWIDKITFEMTKYEK